MIATPSETLPQSAKTTEIGFGGGCHWCTEAVFDSLLGVSLVQQGFISSHAPHQQPSEAVLVNYDATNIPLQILIEIHLRTHASASPHSMRGKYRSAIYFSDAATRVQCKAALTTLQHKFENALITELLEKVEFSMSPERYRKYYASNPDKPFCSTYIAPKLAKIKRDFSEYYKR